MQSLNSASLWAGLILWQVFTMKTDNLEKQVKLLSVLIDGCKRHPAYRAVRPATGRCKPCVDMWAGKAGTGRAKQMTRALLTAIFLTLLSQVASVELKL